MGDGRLSDGTIRLEPLTAGHRDGMAALGRDPDVQRFTYVPTPWKEGFEARWIARYEQGRTDGTCAGFAFADEADGAFLGFAALVRVDPEAREAGAGYIVAPAARGRGVAGRALALLTDLALTELELERIELRITAGNEPSIRVAERCGYVREGVLRSLHFKQGIRTDVAIYSRIPGDPEKGAEDA
jgi:RimJ/RimL family protein N-acetyltransferase